jgi:PAS domain S-box-containing protein
VDALLNRHMQRLSAQDTGALVVADSLPTEGADAFRRLRLLAEGSSDYLLLLDRTLHVVFCNRAIGAWAPRELIGKPIGAVLPAGRERAQACMQRVLQQRCTDRFEVEWPHTGGSVRFMEARVAPVCEQEHTVGVTLNISDTTEHVLAQRAVATQAKMIESMLEGVALIDQSGAIVITNPAFDRLFGHPRGAMIGMSLTVLAGGTALDDGVAAALTGVAGPWPLEFDARHKDGGAVSVAGALSRLSDGGRTHLLLVLQDVGERKLLESALLEAVNREQYRIGNDLHDGLGQELTGIALLLRCLAGRLANEHRAALPDVESITRLVSNAVESTRSLARGLSPVNLERGGLRDALAGLAMHARRVYGIKAVFTHRLQPTLSVDAEAANHLYRIAQEAVTNAVKHGSAKSVKLHLGAARDKLRLTISDDGRGLPADAFDRQINERGGMGLRIMRYRARIARGDVRFERGEPNGTRVICECPLASVTQRQRPHAHAVIEPTHRVLRRRDRHNR